MMLYFPDLRRHKIYVGSTIWRAVEPYHMKSLVYLLRDPHYGYFPEVGDALVERARGTSATHFLRHTDADVHLSLDVDFQKDAIDIMCEQAVKYDIVGAVYICRSVARTYPATFFQEGLRVMFLRLGAWRFTVACSRRWPRPCHYYTSRTESERFIPSTSQCTTTLGER
jgi:hypothetical protein